MHQNVSLGSNGVDRVRSLRIIPARPRSTNFWTSSAYFALSFVRQPNSPECTQIVRNAPKCQFRVQWGRSVAFVAKNSDATSWHELLHLFGPFCTEFRKATKQSRMHPNSTKHTKTAVYGPMGWIGCVRCKIFRRDFVARTFALVRPVLQRVSYDNQTVLDAPKWYEMHQNISLGTNGVDRVCSLRKILTQLRGMNFCTSSARFPPRFVRQPNSPECTQIVRNTPKCQFMVQWVGSEAFVVKNSDVTSWHKLLY